MACEFDKLHDELLINILVKLHRPFAVEMAQYRPVCRRWNKLSRTKDFWKAMCIKDMGPNISPIRLYQGAKISAEARDYVIPIIKEGTKVTVDFMSYYRIRRYFVSLVQWFNTVVNRRNNQLWQGKGTDLTLHNIQAFLKIPWGTINVKHSNGLAQFLFLIIPPLLVHGKKELAQQAFNIITSHGADETNLYMIEYARNCMKIHQVAKENKLPDLAFKAFEAAGKEFLSFMETELLSEPGAAAVFDSIVTQIIRYGAESKAVEREYFDFKYPEQKYQVLSDDKIRIQFPEEYAAPLVSIARREFNQTNDWRVKATALSTVYSLPSGTVEAALQCITFGMDVLNNNDEHAEVKYAAIVLLATIFENWYKDPKFLLSADQYVAIFQLFTNKLAEVPAPQVLAMLRIVLLLSHSVNITHEVIDEKSLDKFHDNLFKMLLTPNVISKSIAPAAGALKKLRLLGCTYGNRLAKYLKKYREVLFTIARTPKLRGDAKLSTEDSVASYVNLLCSVKDFEAEAIELVQQIENKSLGFPVRLPQFYAVCGVACSKLPGANGDHIIKSIFGMLPAKFAAFGSTRSLGDFLAEVADKLREQQKKKQKEEEDEEYDSEDEEYDSEDEMDMSDDEEGGERRPKERTDFLPYTEAQFMQALEKSKTVPKEDIEEFNKCFQFTEPAPVKVGKQSKFVKKIDLTQVDQGGEEEVIESFNGCQTALGTLLKFVAQQGDAYLPHAQKTFHFVLGYCRVAMLLHPENLTSLQSLFKMILPYLDADHIFHYSKIILFDILSGHLTIEEKQDLGIEQAVGILDTLDMIIEALTPVQNISQSIFVVFLDTLAELLNQMPLHNFAKPLEYRVSETFGTLFRKWPKNSIPAYIRSKICAWISESIRETEEDTVPHLAALLMCCHIGLRFGIAFMKMSLAIAPGSVIVRPHDLLDFLEQALARFKPDGTLRGTTLQPPANSHQLLQQTVLLFHGALLYDDMDMLNCYRRYTFDPTIVKDAFLSGDCEFDTDLQDLIDEVADDNYMDLIFPKEFV